MNAKEKMRQFQEKLSTPGLVDAAGSERLDDVKAAMVYAQIDRTLFSQLKNYPEKGVQDSTLQVVQCLLILLGYGSKDHTIKQTFELQNTNTTKKFVLGFNSVSDWPKCRKLLNYQKRLSIDWLLPGFRSKSLVNIDGTVVLTILVLTVLIKGVKSRRLTIKNSILSFLFFTFLIFLQ